MTILEWLAKQVAPFPVTPAKQLELANAINEVYTSVTDKKAVVDVSDPKITELKASFVGLGYPNVDAASMANIVGSLDRVIVLRSEDGTTVIIIIIPD